MRKLNWKAKSLAVTIFVMLVFVWNPELRALLFLLDFLGADLILLLLGGYLHQYWPIVVFYVRQLFALTKSCVISVCKSLRWIAYGLHPRDGHWAQIDHIGIAGGGATRIAIGRLAT